MHFFYYLQTKVDNTAVRAIIEVLPKLFGDGEVGTATEAAAICWVRNMFIVYSF
jgi:hypothetical protein